MENLDYVLSLDPQAVTKTFQKGDIVQRAGDLYGKTYYVKRGLLRSYSIDSRGKEHIFMFAPEEWIIADLESSEFNTPLELYIDCLEDSELLIFNKDCLFQPDLPNEALLKNAKLLYRRIGVLQHRVLMLLGSPAIDRYNYFLETYPDLPNRIPQRMIATYLGITPQALSTIKSQSPRS